MKKENSFAVICIVLLLVLGFYIPSVAMEIEDGRRKSERKSFEIEEIQLSFQNVNIEEEMSIFPYMLLNNIVVEKGDTYSEKELENMQQGTQEAVDLEKSKVKSNVEEFLNVLNPEWDSMFLDFKMTYYVMMVSKEDERVYPIWVFYGVDEEKREYFVWLDDMSGTVLAYDIPFEVMGMSDEAFYLSMERMSAYYGYDIFGFVESFSNLCKTNSWQNVWMMMDAEGNEGNSSYMFKVGERFMFNVYPGSISVSDGTYSENE